MRWLALVAAGMASLTLCGCFDGTVRDSPEAAGGGHQGKSGKSHQQRQREHERAGGEGGGEGEATVSFAAVGDTGMGITPELPPDPSTYLDPIAGELKGDVVFGNLEGTLTDVSEDVKCGGAKPGTCYAFRTPPGYAKYYASAGFTVMNLANNHSYDFGETGQGETIEALRGAGVEPTGLPAEAAEVTAGGRRIAFLGFAPYGYTNLLTDLESARALIRAARESADLVVVAIHAGAEGSDATHTPDAEETYLGEDRGNAVEFAHMAVRAGADLVLGSGPHVLRGMEVYRGRLIAYSLGNFCGYHNFSTEGVLGETVVLHATLAADGRFRAGRLASVRMVEAGQPVPDPEGAGAALVGQLSAEDFGPSGVEVDAEGRITRERTRAPLFLCGASTAKEQRKPGVGRGGWRGWEDGGVLPLLLINGYAATGADWDPTFLAELKRSHRVLRPDNRGVGAAPLGDGELTIAAMAADMEALLDAEGIEALPVVGWSMGGFVAQQLARRAPRRVTALALISTDPGGGAAVPPSPEVWAKLTDHSGSPREQATRLISLLFPPPLAHRIDLMFGDVVAEARAGLAPQTLSAQEKAMVAWHRAEQPRADGEAPPTVVLHGTEDVVIPPANAGALTTRWPGAAIELFEGSGHAVMAQEPQRVAAAIRDHLAPVSPLAPRGYGARLVPAPAPRPQAGASAARASASAAAQTSPTPASYPSASPKKPFLPAAS